MQRVKVAPRDSWQAKVEGRGFNFHTPINPQTKQPEAYWEEEAMYRLTEKQVNDLYDAAQTLNDMCYGVIQQVVDDESNKLLNRFQIPQMWWDMIRSSWRNKETNLYGRMDFTVSDGNLKLMEFNADTPTTLYEAGVAQWDRLEDSPYAHFDQFNSLHEDFIKAWGDKRRNFDGQVVYFACVKNTLEDKGTVDYLRDLANQAGVTTRFIYLEDIGLSTCGMYLTDLDDRIINILFKLYPWEMMAKDEFGKAVCNLKCRFIEPSWKAIISNKALLPMLWKMYPEHPNLLPAYFEDDPQAKALTHYVRKPIYGREGANVTIVMPEKVIASQDSGYGSEGFIRQAFAPLPQFKTDNGKSVYAMLGVWIIGGVNDDPDDLDRNGQDKPSGLTVREDDGPVTSDNARFVPHFFIPK